MRAAAPTQAPVTRAVHVTASPAVLLVLAAMSALVTTASASPSLVSLTAALALLGAATLASMVPLLRSVVARVAATVLLVLTARHRPPRAPRPAPLRQQDPATPGRPRPRAPGATPLPRAA